MKQRAEQFTTLRRLARPHTMEHFVIALAAGYQAAARAPAAPASRSPPPCM